jgi:hypothetical protein
MRRDNQRLGLSAAAMLVQFALRDAYQTLPAFDFRHSMAAQFRPLGRDHPGFSSS